MVAPMIAEFETNINRDDRHLNAPANQYQYQLRYHSSIVHIFHHHIRSLSIMSGTPPLPNVVTLPVAGSIPNLFHITTPEGENQRDSRFHAEPCNGKFSHLHRSSFQDEELPHVQVEGISKVQVNSGPKSPPKPKSDSSYKQSHPNSVHFEAQSTKQSPRSERRRVIDDRWHLLYIQLKDYHRIHGNTIVPRGYTLNTKLGSWVAEQRKQYRLQCDGNKSAMTPQRLKLLEELGFVWNAQEDAWCRQMARLRRFHAEHGHCNVQVGNPDYPKLGLWVKEQRRHYMLMKSGKSSLLTFDRYRQLSEVEFCYDSHESIWQCRMSEMCEFKRVHGHCLVSSSNASAKLSVWVHHQRRQYRKMTLGLPCHITAERVNALDSLNFVWSPRMGRHSKKHDADDSDADTNTDDVSSDIGTDENSGSDVDEPDPPVKKRRKNETNK